MGLAVSSLRLTQNARDLRLEGATLHATVQVIAAGLQDGAPLKDKVQFVAAGVHDATTYKPEWAPATFPLDLVFGNVNGVFQFGFKYFSHSARNIRLVGTILDAELKNEKGEWVHSSINIDDKFYVGFGGKIIAKEVPVLIPVPKDAQNAVLQQLTKQMEANPALKLAALDHHDGTTTFVATTETDPNKIFVGVTNHSDESRDAKVGYYRVGIDLDGTDPDAVFKTMDASAKAAVFHVASTKGHPISQYSADFLEAKAGAKIGGVTGGNDGFPVYAGVDAKVNLIDLQASVFDLNVGAGVQTDIGLNDYSVGGHLLGCGFTIGKKVSISAFGSSFGIDFGRLFG